MEKNESCRGTLVKDKREHIPIEKLVESDFWSKMARSQTNGCGVYILFNQDDVYYIGLTKKSLRSRIKNHTNDKHKGKWTHFSYYQICEAKYAKDLESILIRVFKKPSGNKVSGHFG